LSKGKENNGIFERGGKSQPNFTDSTPRRLGLDFTYVLARRVKSTRPRARLPASGQTRKP